MAHHMPDYHHAVEVSCGRIDLVYYLGRRPLVLLIHGNSACKEIFAAQISLLREQGYGVLALDLPGHGASENAKNPSAVYSFPGYAGIVAEILDFFAIESIHVVGWSLGGHVGLELMGRDARVASLLIVGTPAAKMRMESLAEAFLPSGAMNYAGQRDFSLEDAIAYGEAVVGGPEFLTPDLLKAVRRTDGDARFWMVQNAMNGLGLDEWDLAERDVRPLAVLHGDKDPFINLAYLRKPAYRNLWRGAVQVLEGVGHAAHWQAPDQFNELLLSFLQEVSGELSPGEAAVEQIGGGGGGATWRPILKIF
ncbi:MAG: alpha/beta hydrolase [Beijerinckiaceae bacterium]|jgi:pimeloyl-ACP methyl ester carboxylesterase